jgi:Flp pilus assembly pilin Flp
VRISSLPRVVRRLLREQQAATATEYAVMLALVLGAIIATVTVFGQTLGSEYTRVNGELFSP